MVCSTHKQPHPCTLDTAKSVDGFLPAHGQWIPALAVGDEVICAGGVNREWVQGRVTAIDGNRVVVRYRNHERRATRSFARNFVVYQPKGGTIAAKAAQIRQSWQDEDLRRQLKLPLNGQNRVATDGGVESPHGLRVVPVGEWRAAVNEYLGA